MNANDLSLLGPRSCSLRAAAAITSVSPREIRTRAKRNVVQARSFADLLDQAVRKYQNGSDACEIHSLMASEDIDEALSALAAVDRRKSQVVEMRFFGGLTVDETAAALQVSRDTVARNWKMAKLWLLRELRGGTHDLS